jgi:Uma2 family endonuclease
MVPFFAMVAPLSLRFEPHELRPLRVSDYDLMVEAGVLTEKDRVELIEGALVQVAPQGEEHAWVVQRLTRLLVQRLSEEFEVRPALPLTVGEYSEPEPDFAIVTAAQGNRKTSHPDSAVLVIEVSRSSLRMDRMVKSRVYARGGIPEYWVIDVDHRRAEVFRQPNVERAEYLEHLEVSDEGTLASTSLPELTFELADLLP